MEAGDFDAAVRGSVGGGDSDGGGGGGGVEKAQYNFAPASKRSSAVFGCERAGFAHPVLTPAATPGQRTPRGPMVPETSITAWCAFLKHQGVTRLLCLLTDGELSFFDGGAGVFWAATRSAFKKVTHVPVTKSDARKVILKELSDAIRCKEPIAVHCSSGQGRTGNVLALWLHHHYHLPVEEAVVEINSYARSQGATRKASASGVLRLLQVSTARAASSRTPRASAPPLAPGLGLHPGLPLAIGSARMSFGSSSVTSAPQAPSPANSTSRNSTRGSVVSVASSSAASARRPRNSIVSSALVGQLPAANADTHVTVLQTGGTIDKDYPKTKGGYSFEIGAAAVKRVLRVLRVPAAFTVDVRTVCRKDSQDITEKERAKIVEACVAAVSNRIIITHGTDTMIESAQYVDRMSTVDSPAGSSVDDRSSAAGDTAREPGAGASGGAGAGAGAGASGDGGGGGGGGVAAAGGLSPSSRGRVAKPQTPAERAQAGLPPDVGATLRTKTIIFTGALRPERFSDSDAAFNIGGAFTAVSILPPGVYVAMHGRVFAAQRCTRDGAGTFVASAVPALATGALGSAAAAAVARHGSSSSPVAAPDTVRSTV